MTSLRTKLRQLPTHSGPFPFAPPTPTTLPATPTAAFRSWLSDAIAHEIIEPHAMTLSTVDNNSTGQGQPDARVLILKDLDERGWQFAIRGDGPKATQLDGNPNVALTFYWAELGRQVRIRGLAVRLSAEEEEADWEQRPRASKVAAAASRQSQVLGSLEELRGSVEKFTTTTTTSTTSAEDTPRPSWRVYAVSPDVVEFWQRSADRLHQRVRFRRDDGNGEGEEGWVKELLWP